MSTLDPRLLPVRPGLRRTVAVVCAWCRASLGLRPASPATAGAVSHGLCPDCARRLAAR